MQAERPTSTVVGRDSLSGAPIVQVQLSHRVNYSDLSLTIPSNVKVLKTRVHDAARSVCSDLDRLYPVTMGPDDCVRKAEQSAMAQVESAIALAEARKRTATR